MNYAILWDNILMTVDGNGRVACETVESYEKAAESIITRFPRGQLSLAYENRDLRTTLDENFQHHPFRSKTRDLLRDEHPQVTSIANGWGYEHSWMVGAYSHGFVYLEQSTVLSQICEHLAPRKMDLVAAWPIHALNMAWLTQTYGKHPDNHYSMVISQSGVCFSGKSLTGGQVYQKAIPEHPGEGGFTDLWPQVAQWLADHLGFGTSKSIGATLDVFVADDSLQPEQIWPEWNETKNLRIKIHDLSPIFTAFKRLSPQASSNLITDFPHPTELTLPAKIVAGLLLVVAAVVGITGLSSLSSLRAKTVAIERQVTTNQNLEKLSEKNKEEITRLQEIYGPWVVMTDEGRGTILTTLSRTNDRILPEGTVLREVTISDTNQCRLIFVMPSADSKEITAKTTKMVELLRKVHPELNIRPENIHVEPITGTVQIDSEFKF